MTDYRSIYGQIQTITQKLIAVGLSISQQFPSCKQTGNNSYEISYSGMKDLSIVLKNIEYSDVYHELDSMKNYNIKMIDGALIQLLYTYKSSVLTSHRLAFFPSPSLHTFQNMPEIYERDEIYADIIAKNIFPVPLRFDYDPDNYEDILHPKCHLTMGQYKNCRIPVSAPISPNIFISFLLRSFYNIPYRRFADELDFSSFIFEESISLTEKKILHLAID